MYLELENGKRIGLFLRAKRVVEEYLAEKYGEMPSDEEIEKIMKDIISEVNDKLPTFKIIRDVTVRKEDFIRTTTRKIKRAANI